MLRTHRLHALLPGVTLALLLLLPAIGCRRETAPPPPPPPPPFDPDVPALEHAPKASPRAADHPALSGVDELADSWFVDGDRRRTVVQLDKPLYRAGETVWVKTWDLTERGLAGAAEGRDLEVVLLDGRGSTLQTSTIRETGGTGRADFALASDAAGGEYSVQVRSGGLAIGDRTLVVAAYQAPRLRKELEFVEEAYGPGDKVHATVEITRSGGGALASHPLRALISVDGRDLEPVRVVTDDRGEAAIGFELPAELVFGTGLLTVVIDDDGVVESIARPIPILMRDLSLDFYPEGGDLVAGLSSRVYFEGRGRFGRPADVAGWIEDDTGARVARFASVHDGLGRMTLTPQAGRRYRARVEQPAGLEELTFDLPLPLSAGCVLRTFDDPEGVREELRAAVTCSDRRTIVAVGAQRGEIFDRAAAVAGPDSPAVVSLKPPPALARARSLARVTVLDDRLEPLAERLFFRNYGAGLSIALEVDDKQYSPRGRVGLTVTSRGATGEPVPAEIAVSVVDDAVLKLADDKTGTILAGVLLEPELPGDIHEVGYYFDPEEEDAPAMLELLVGARGWRRFREETAREAAQVAAVTAPVLERAAGEEKPDTRSRAQGHPAEPPPVEAAARRDDRVEEESRSLGLLAAIGTTGASSRDETVADLLSDPGYLSDDVSAALEEGDGVRVAETGSGRGQVVPGSEKDLSSSAGGSVQGQAQTRPVARATIHALDLEDVEVEVRAQAMRTFRRYLGRFKSCYERELKTTPTLAGQLELSFTVREHRVRAAGIDASTVGSTAVGECGQRVLRRVPFHHDGFAGEVEGTVALRFHSEPAPVSTPWPHTVHEPDPPRRTTGRTPPRPQRSRYSKVREFPIPRYDPDEVAGPRTDFRDTVLWAPAVKTDAQGRAELEFWLSDAVTTFTIHAEGASGDDLGRADHRINSQLPFSMSVKLPAEVSAGDRLELPVALQNRRSTPTPVGFDAELGDLLTTTEAHRELGMGAGGGTRILLPIEVGDGDGLALLRLIAKADGLNDQVEQTIRVVPRGYPHEVTRSGRLESTAAHTLELPSELHSARAAVTLHPNPLSSFEEAVAGLVRSPTGCFEQSSSKNYLNVLALRFMKSRGGGDPSAMRRTRGYLDAGIRKLTSYEAPGGGFEWYGRDPGHEVLTGLALAQLTETRRVHRGVSQELLDRTGAWLRSRTDTSGRYYRSDGYASRYGSVSQDLAAAWITWSLVTSGVGAEDVALQRQRKLASKADDPYQLALAAMTLLALSGDEAAGRQAAGRLASLQQEDGSWMADETITRSGGTTRRVESTGLALQALLQAGGHTAAVERGIGWLQDNRRGSTWGSTQATTMALGALAAWWEQEGGQGAPGTVQLLVDGVTVASASYNATRRDPLVLRFSDQLHPGSNRVELKQQGGGPLPYSIVIRARTRLPDSHPDASVTIETSLDKPQPGLGEPVRLDLVLRNQRSDDVPFVMARVGLPAGLSSQPWQLDRLVEEGRVAAWEQRGRQVVLYLDGLAASTSERLSLELLAEIPGRTTGPASSAWLYYTPGQMSWAPELEVEVSP